ncbi:MAG: hypothetical protein ACPGO3_12510 [Magnetospiraceae bacterium]
MAINPDLFREFSPEWLTVHILDQEITREGPVETIRLTARVMSVERSAAGLKPGDEIVIAYQRDDRQLDKVRDWMADMERNHMVGEPPDHPPTPPDTGATVRAYLAAAPSAGERIFKPDAHHHSFETLP